MQSKHIGSFLVVAIVVGGLGFYGGTVYAKKSQTGQRPAGIRNGQTGQGFQVRGPGGAGSGGGFTAGEVMQKDGNSITLKLRDGGSKIVFYSSSTTVGKMSAGSMDDVTHGANVTVTGNTNPDGSVAASAVQIRPEGDFMGRGPGPAPSASAPAAHDPNAREIIVTSSNFKFDMSSITVKKGEKIRIRLKNVEGFHDLVIDEFKAATERVQGEGETAVEFTADRAGTFEYYCSVGSHREMGMKGTLTVTE
ncbi:MAG TPA: plastocyanin/azurin family copper-binding protein [Candidatus Methylomirabilis sp.]|nr:plastocyanin/azurin family copper-binding protein [Candidatus Methylomirabilis sp.]